MTVIELVILSSKNWNRLFLVSLGIDMLNREHAAYCT